MSKKVMKHYIGEGHIIDHEERTEREQKLAAMVDERLASLARRVDLLYRYTVGDRTGRHTLVPNMHQRGDEFPEAER